MLNPKIHKIVEKNSKYFIVRKKNTDKLNNKNQVKKQKNIKTNN